jgi:methyl-accepting chemotaxis protein
MLVQLVDRLTQQVTGFGAAIEQVKRSSHDIDTIAQTTSILALNATIEAARAGEFGRSFSVVADEVKALARRTRDATAEIARTVEALSKEANQVIVEIDAGTEVNRNARDSVSKIEGTLSVVSEMVDEVDRQNAQVTSANAAISDHVDLLQTSLKSVDSVAQENVENLERVQGRAGELENTAKVMFDELVHAGLSPKDDQFVAFGIESAKEIIEIAQSAIESGAISENDLFDDNYIEIAGSHPQRYRNRATDWADNNWRPVLDRIKASRNQIAGTVCMDRNGFVPTHITEFSRTPTGDYDHDVKFCRNGRKFPVVPRDPSKELSDYSMSTYRFEAEGEGRGYQIVRVVSVPIILQGRHWGNYTLTYTT